MKAITLSVSLSRRIGCKNQRAELFGVRDFLALPRNLEIKGFLLPISCKKFIAFIGEQSLLFLMSFSNLTI
jgi:hypothetical protein